MSASPISTPRCSIRRSGFARSRWSALQAEYHPYLDQDKLIAATRQRGMAFVAYCPLGRGRMFSDPVLAEIAKARGRSIAQVALRWSMQQGIIPIPRSSKPERIADNLKVTDFTLSR